MLSDMLVKVWYDKTMVKHHPHHFISHKTYKYSNVRTPNNVKINKSLSCFTKHDTVITFTA